MHSNNKEPTQFQSSNEIRVQFTLAMSAMYQLEVPLYKEWLSLTDENNQKTINHSSPIIPNEHKLLNLEHHGAIRVGSNSELFMIRRLFNVMGMQPVDYYDLSVAGIPVHSTAFRALNATDLEESPFRVFCSLLRLELINNKSLREQATQILNKREIFPEKLIELIYLSEKQGGLTSSQVNVFIDNALNVFRWHKNAIVSKETYDALKNVHGLVADIVCFKGPHINHLTPKVLDIDASQKQFENRNIKAKATIEGPPKRNCPILLRQTSFIAIAEKVVFLNGESGSHTARFGEIEQRAIALTPKGRKLYDRFLQEAQTGNSQIHYEIRLDNAFKEFPDTYDEIRRSELGYFHYTAHNIKDKIRIQSNDIESLIADGFINVSPMVYEDFLPVSAAGIFTSNLSSESNKSFESPASITIIKENPNQHCFEKALGIKIVNSFELYESAQQASLNEAMKQLGIN